jgi:hypothetical protein
MAGTTMDKEAEGWAAALMQARKGKARNFAIFAKGSTVLGLMVAKRLGSGEVLGKKAELKANKVIEGVALGEGATIVFYATSEIGLKPAILREWISEEFGIKVKPSFAVVKDLAEVGKDAAPKADDKAKDSDKAKSAKTADKDRDKPDKKQQARQKKLTAELAEIVKTRADVLRSDAKAAKLLKPIKSALDEGKLDLAEKAIRALDAATGKAAAGSS